MKKLLTLILVLCLTLCACFGCGSSNTKNNSNITSEQSAMIEDKENQTGQTIDSSSQIAKEKNNAVEENKNTSESKDEENKKSTEDVDKDAESNKADSEKEDNKKSSDSKDKNASTKDDNKTSDNKDKNTSTKNDDDKTSDSKDKNTSTKDDSNKDTESKDDAKKDDSKDSTSDKDKSSNKKYLICIDPGHQTKGDMSKEPIGPGSSEKKFKVSWGTQGVSTKLPEYELNLQASKILKNYLEEMGFKVIMTRYKNDVNISNAERAVFANNAGADLVLRIHADGSDNKSISGASLHIPASGGKYTKGIYKESNKCAKLIFNDMKSAGFKVRSIYQRSDLTGFNWSKVPAVLVEMGYMSNPAEDEKMADKSYQKKMMKCIAKAVKNYFY